MTRLTSNIHHWTDTLPLLPVEKRIVWLLAMMNCLSLSVRLFTSATSRSSPLYCLSLIAALWSTFHCTIKIVGWTWESKRPILQSSGSSERSLSELHWMTCFPTSTLTSKLFIMFFLQGGRFESKCKLSDILRPTDMSSLSIPLPPFSNSFTPNQDPHKASHSVISLELDLKG